MSIKSLDEVALFSAEDLDAMEADILRIEALPRFRVKTTLISIEGADIPAGAGTFYHSGYDVAARLLAQVRRLQREKEAFLDLEREVRADERAVQTGHVRDFSATPRALARLDELRGIPVTKE